MKKFFLFLVFVILVLGANSVFAQVVKFGPRLSGNFNIYNEKGSTLSRNGLGIGRTVDVSFTQHIGLMLDLTVFDMKNFSASVTNANVIQEDSRSLSYISLDPMFKTDFSGFYMVGGPSLGIKLNSGGQLYIKPKLYYSITADFHVR